MERRRSWAASGRMPPRLAARFTLAEAAVLSVVAVEVAKAGACTLTVGHIAALAGVSETSVRNAMREAQGLGFIRVEERRLSAWRNAPNRVTILSPEWLSWLRLARKGGGCKTVYPTTTKEKKKGFQREEAAQALAQTSQVSPAQALSRPYSAAGPGSPTEPGVDRSPPTAVPRVQRWGVHGDARLRRP